MLIFKCSFYFLISLFICLWQVGAYHEALRSNVDCIEIDVSRSSDGVLFALHDRYTPDFSIHSISNTT